MHGKIDIAKKKFMEDICGFCKFASVSTNKNNPQETEAVNFEPRLHGGIL